MHTSVARHTPAQLQTVNSASDEAMTFGAHNKKPYNKTKEGVLGPNDDVVIIGAGARQASSSSPRMIASL
jgi:hypothetical protein